MAMKKATAEGSTCVERSSETQPALEKRSGSLKAASTSACRESAQKPRRSLRYAGASSPLPL